VPHSPETIGRALTQNIEEWLMEDEFRPIVDRKCD
jgi:hypothetical protein